MVSENSGAKRDVPNYPPDPAKGRECYLITQLIRDEKSDLQPLGVIAVEYSSSLFDLKQEPALLDLSNITLTNFIDQSVIYTNGHESPIEILPSSQNSVTETVHGTPFILSITVDYPSLVLEYRQILYTLACLTIFCIICSLLIMLWFSHNFLKPIEELGNCMTLRQPTNAGKSHDYENRKDEIGCIYRQYNTMIRENNEFIRTEYQNRLILLDSQMKAMEARINSHFLFNTLESINSMAELADQKQISTMSLALGHMFRYAIKTDSELVTVWDELQHVQDYITIQKIRCDNQFQFIEDVPEELYDQKILKLIFQPLVENAFSHGLEYGSSGDQIILSIRAEDNLLLITVADNGKGMSREKLESLKLRLREEAHFTELGSRKKESIGLKNIQSRVELYYGKGYGLDISSTKEKGTTIRIRVPVFQNYKEG